MNRPAVIFLTMFLHRFGESMSVVSGINRIGVTRSRPLVIENGQDASRLSSKM